MEGSRESVADATGGAAWWPSAFWRPTRGGIYPVIRIDFGADDMVELLEGEAGMVYLMGKAFKVGSRYSALGANLWRGKGNRDA